MADISVDVSSSFFWLQSSAVKQRERFLVMPDFPSNWCWRYAAQTRNKWNTGVIDPVTFTCLPYSHEHLPQWDRACAQCVQLLSHTNHRLAPSPPSRRVGGCLHAPYKPRGHSCFCPPWRIHRTSPTCCSPLFDPWSCGASTEDSSLDPPCLVPPSCLVDRLYRICACTWAPRADREYLHKLDRKGRPGVERVWSPFLFTGLWRRGPRPLPCLLKATSS